MSIKVALDRPGRAVNRLVSSFSSLYVLISSTDDKKKDDKKKGDGDHKHRSPSSDSRRVKQETVDPHLLLSCVYFDQNHCGYLLERDLEDISHSIGIGLSRSQVLLYL